MARDEFQWKVKVSSWRLAAALILIIAAFMAQNYKVMEIQFLFWTFKASRAIVLLMAFALGWGAGWLLASGQKR